MKSFRPWQGIAVFVITTTLFALAYSQSPLYSSNQYQYFLHGLARAGVGTLAEDWLANTTDPTPVFSLLVEITARIQAMWLNYLYYALLMGIYLFSLASIVESAIPVKKSLQTFLLFLAGMILFHSAGIRYLLPNIPGEDWAYLFEGGVAGQRLLGPVFQPSVFGVFLLLSVALYLRKKPVGAGISAVFAATVHPTYLLGAAVLILTYLVDLFFVERRRQKAVGVGFVALIAAGPILAYTVVNFMGGSPETAEQAREILVNIRIPHHALITEWFDATVVLKLLLLGTALYFMRRCKLFLLIALPLGISILLSLVQFVTGNYALALLFPWRISTWLVPIGLTVVLGKASLALGASLPAARRYMVTTSALVVILLCVVAGIGRTWFDAKKAAKTPALGVEGYVAQQHHPGEEYLVPVKMYDFRLNAEAPTYGDIYSIPYRYDEVIEWFGRFLDAKYFYDSANCDLLDDLAWQGITHVILPVDFPDTCKSVLSPVYTDDAYGLYVLAGDQ